MSEHSDRNANAELLRADLRKAFPEATFTGSVTDADGLQDEALDEPRALYGALRDRKWSEVERSIVSSFPDGFLLLTDPAFVAFLPAWLLATLEDHKVRQSLVYSFSPDVHRSSKEWDPRIRKLTRLQRKTLVAFLRFCLQVDSSESVKKEAQNAIAFAERLCAGG